jgi:rubrerythrin
MAAELKPELRRFFMIELNDFYNDGHGWICRACDRELAPAAERTGLPRFFTEGEAESRTPEMSTRALAKWTDATRRFLTCPRCGITEAYERS